MLLRQRVPEVGDGGGLALIADGLELLGVLLLKNTYEY